jgi:DNA-binding FadR family transcriptional regulator
MRDSDHSGDHANAAAARTRILALVEAGGLGPTGRLPSERALCAAWGIGRRAIRQALSVLEAEGVVWRQQGKGTFAGAPPDPTARLAAGIVGETTPAEVMEARLCVEPVLARLAALRATPADAERLKGIAERVARASDPDDVELWDGTLHRQIAELSGNRPLITAYGMLDEIRANPAWRGLRQRARSARTLRVTTTEHRRIVTAIGAGDGAAAEAAMRDHLTTLAAMLRRLDRREGTG